MFIHSVIQWIVLTSVGGSEDVCRWWDVSVWLCLSSSVGTRRRRHCHQVSAAETFQCSRTARAQPFPGITVTTGLYFVVMCCLCAHWTGK